ncbi:endogenous retrovirus group K member 8 Pro protein-like protein [Willisornis vidua]|uniref:Endogenous retrovirus group K member 8 Pro protein-like protein n=1 Tax=Willisornis vidua TaxID=1566151 RepID=A0ABQ9CJK9_9PASS|nr:endogenous retrovirus group K member 8 Pro protein-like protein [Willisornis vidua]
MKVTSKQPLEEGEEYLLQPAAQAAQRGIIAQTKIMTINGLDNLNGRDITVFFKVLLPPVEVSSKDLVAVLLPTSQLQRHQPTEKAVNWTTTLTGEQPLLSVVVASPLGRTNIEGLLDTGADITIIAIRDWPDIWPKEETMLSVTGVGGTLKPMQSRHVVTFTDPDGNVASCRPLILPLPMTLWGRDILGQSGAKLKTNF